MTDHSPSGPTQEDEKQTSYEFSQTNNTILSAPKLDLEDLPETPDDAFEVTLDAEDDPKQWSVVKKWFVTIIVCNGALCITCASSMVSCEM